MSNPAPSPRRSSKSTPDPLSTPTPQPGPGAWERLSGVLLRLDRFGWDILGVALIAFALTTLIGLLGFTSGALINAWAGVLRRWLGWGAFLAVVALALLGLVAIRWQSDRRNVVPIGRILALEAVLFLGLALTALFGGMSVERADQGLDGGLVGWGLAEIFNRILPPPFSTGLITVLIFVFLALGSGLVAKIGAWLEASLADELPAQPTPAETFPEEAQAPLSAPEAPAPRAARRTKGAPAAAEPAPVPQRSREGLPPLNLLSAEQGSHPDEDAIHDTARLIEDALAEFGVPARVMGFRVGPTVTQFAVEPGFIEKVGPDGTEVRQKVRVAQISNLARDLALRLSAERLRIEAPVPGQSFVGIEVPNPHSTAVRLRSLLETPALAKLNSPLALALGKDVSGQAVVADLARMPHVLIAGTTGSGKSVCIAALTTCLVMNNTPAQLRLAMLDPKMVELVRFNGLPHLLGKVETDIDRMLSVLRWAMAEMDARYRMLEDANTRDIETYNRRMERKQQPPLPRIVVMIDELADLMMSAPEQTEHSIVRLAQMARAVGIHLVVATQRPSTDVVTGLIKANFPARISFTVASAVDSRVILDTNGAETLLGRGDMLFLNPENGIPLRCQGVMVSDGEVEKVISYWQKVTAPAGDETAQAEPAPWEELLTQDEEESGDDLVKQAIDVVKTSRRASASLLQRRLRIGYPRAARLIDEMEALGVVGPAQAGGREREVLISEDEADDAGGLDDEA